MKILFFTKHVFSYAGVAAKGFARSHFADIYVILGTLLSNESGGAGRMPTSNGI